MNATKLFSLCFLVANTLVGMANAGETRLWTGKNGKQIVGKFVSSAFGKITLEIDGKETLPFPLTSLSPKDQLYAMSIREWKTVNGSFFKGRLLSIEGETVSFKVNGTTQTFAIRQLDKESQGFARPPCGGLRPAPCLAWRGDRRWACREWIADCRS